MNRLVLVDTSAWLFALKKDFIAQVKNKIDHLLRENSIAILGIIKLELLGGTKTAAEFNRLKSRLDALHIVETDESLWDEASLLSYKIRREGVTIPYTDILIAACALKYNFLLLHADKHFDLLSNHIDLKVESFVKVVRGVGH